MATQKVILTRQETFLVFLVVLGIGVSIFIFWKWNANSYYTNAYAPVIRASEARHGREKGAGGSESAPSNQPASHGIKESDIEKQEGHRFRAF